ncbi:MAG: ABC transporter permease [Spirochaetaceae bacterium]|jgi:simple sugar transport system permease protein|nr:ABC transporter permease [Spirochaetaceae bacterium]
MKSRRSLYRDFAFGALIPLGAAFLIPLVFIFLGSEDPVKTLAGFFIGPWSNPWFLGNTLDSMTLLLMGSLGAAVAFRGGCFNLGGEGQIYLGGCAAAAVLLSRGTLSGPALLFLAAFAAAGAGGVVGGLSGLLRQKLGVNELISSFLAGAALIPLGDYVISGVLRDPEGNLLSTEQITGSRLLPRIFPPSVLSISIIIVPVCMLLLHLLIHRTALGYRFRISGAAPDLARFSGINAEKRFLPAMAGSGIMAGLTGFFAVAGTYGTCYQGFPAGLGWNAIAVALIAGSEPLFILPVAFIFNAVKTGADTAMLQAGFGFETAAFIQAAVLLLAALPFSSRYLSGKRND